MIGRYFSVKNVKKFSDYNEKICLKIPYRYREILKKRTDLTQL